MEVKDQNNNDMLNKMRASASKSGFIQTPSELISNGYVQADNIDQLRELFEMIISDQLHTAFHPRMQQEVIVVLSKAVTKAERPEQDDLSKMIQWFCLYLNLCKKPSLIVFHSLSKSKFKKHSFFKNAVSADMTVSEWRILTGTVFGYLSGYHPVYMSNLKLSPKELADYSLVLAQNKSSLSAQNLIHFTPDSDGINYRASMTTRTLQLILDRATDNQNSERVVHSMFGRYVTHNAIEDVRMIYEPATERLFQSFIKVIPSGFNSPDFNLSVLLHGPSGTGKTGFVRQLARALQADIFQLDFSAIQSKWIGETEKNIKAVFEEYYRIKSVSKKPVILLLNEADGLMNKRVPLHNSTDLFSNHAQTQLLETLENFKGIVMATTNLLSQFDPAFHRRFLFKIHIGQPDTTVRQALWQKSTLSSKISTQRHADIITGNWTAAQLELVERKVNLLSSVDTLNEEEILFMMQEEGLLSRYRGIGFNPTKTYTKHEPHK
jgi:hypothetical protein